MSTTIERRQSQRVTLKKRATLIFFHTMGRVENLSCLIVDRSQDGLRLNASSGLRRGPLVDLILNEDPCRGVRGSVVWIGGPGSKPEGQAGLQIF